MLLTATIVTLGGMMREVSQLDEETAESLEWQAAQDRNFVAHFTGLTIT